MGCTSSRRKAEAPPTVAVRPPEEDKAGDAPGHATSSQELTSPVVSKPTGVFREGNVTFDSGSHSQIDVAEPGEVRSRSLLSWKESCWSKEEVSSTSRWKGIRFTCDLGFLVAGLKVAPGKVGDSYAAVDFGFYCMEHGRVQIFELGELKYTHSSKYTSDTVFQVRIVGEAVKYVIDQKVVFTSESSPASPLHFQATFSGHPCAIRNLTYLESSGKTSLKEAAPSSA